MNKAYITMRSQSVNLSASNGDGDAAIDSLKNCVVHAVRVEMPSFRKSGSVLMFDEKKDTKGVATAVHGNPLNLLREFRRGAYLAAANGNHVSLCNDRSTGCPMCC